MKQSSLSNFFKTLAIIPEVPEPSQHGDQVNPEPTAECQQPRPAAKRKYNDYESTKRTRVYQDSWRDSFSWVRYDKEFNVMYCEPCREYAHIHPSKGINMIKGMFIFIDNKLQYLLMCYVSIGFTVCMLLLSI